MGDVNANMCIYVADNGNGIPKSAQEKIFDKNFSTKPKKSLMRGNGLSINRFILENCGGKIKLIESTENGTVFCLTLSAEKITIPACSDDETYRSHA